MLLSLLKYLLNLIRKMSCFSCEKPGSFHYCRSLQPKSTDLIIFFFFLLCITLHLSCFQGTNLFGCHEKNNVLILGKWLRDVLWFWRRGVAFLWWGKKMYKLVFFNCEHSFCALYLKLQILDQLVWVVTCCGNMPLPVWVFLREF